MMYIPARCYRREREGRSQLDFCCSVTMRLCRFLLEVSRGRRVCFPDCYFLDAHSSGCCFLESGASLVIEIFREIFSRWIQRGEWSNIVDHLMIEALYHRLHHLFKLLEIEQKPSIIQLAPLQGDANFVVVAMRILAFASVIAQVMSCRKTIFNSHFVHDSSSLSPRKERCGNSRFQQ